MIAALYVAKGGCYYGLHEVDPWDEDRDARRYAGPWPVVAHPPCARWSMLANERLGEDGGCFASALAAVREYGGVLEHPAGSRAYRVHGLTPPKRGVGWMPADDGLGWICCVEQGHYGHRARKAPWLYAVGCDLPELEWGASVAVIQPRPGRDPKLEARVGAVQRMGAAERRRTPIQFREILLGMARTVIPCGATVSDAF